MVKCESNLIGKLFQRFLIVEKWWFDKFQVFKFEQIQKMSKIKQKRVEIYFSCPTSCIFISCCFYSYKCIVYIVIYFIVTLVYNNFFFDSLWHCISSTLLLCLQIFDNHFLEIKNGLFRVVCLLNRSDFVCVYVSLKVYVVLVIKLFVFCWTFSNLVLA